MEGGPTVDPPKRGQVRRALDTGGFPELSSKYMPILRAKGQPDKDALRLLAECFKIENVMPKAVLLQTPGMRLSNYTTESDFLDLLKDEHRHVRHYFGQCVAYDDDEEEVPESLEDFSLSEAVMDRWRKFEWAHIDVINDVLLLLSAKEEAAEFDTHDWSKAYHFADMIDRVAGSLNKLFLGMGYPKHVDSSEGITYLEFVKKIKKIQKASIGLEEEQAQGLFKLIDTFMVEGLQEAADDCRVQLYGAGVDMKRLRAWLTHDSLLLGRVENAIKQLKKKKEDRVYLPGVFTDTPKARTAPGFAMASSSIGRAPSGPRDIDKRSRKDKRAEKKAAEAAAEAAAAAASGGTAGTGGAKASGKLKAGPNNEEPVQRLGSKQIMKMTREERIAANPRGVYYYDDGTFSKGSLLFDWPGIATLLGADPNEKCGPAICSTNTVVPRHCDCMDGNHLDDAKEHEQVQYNGKEFKLEQHFKDFESKGLITRPEQLAGAREQAPGKFKPPGQPKRVGKRSVFPHFG